MLNLIKYFISLYYWDIVPVGSLKRMQLKKFRKVFEYAKKHSPFYRDFYTKHGVINLKIDSFEDIQKIPIINKEIMREYGFEKIMTCEKTDEINIHSTSGSTGEPFRIAYSKFEDYSAHVRLTREYMKHGYTPFKKIVLLSRYYDGHKFEVEEDLGRIAKLQKKFNLFSRDVISIFEPLDVIIEKIEKSKPYVVWSTPSIIHMLANKLEAGNKRLNIPLLHLMSETISPAQLKLFRDRVCESVLDSYGAMEIPGMGFSKNDIKYKKLIPNTVFAEVINQRILNDEKVGDIIVTNLINKTMPFIRYDLGDYVGVLDSTAFPTKKIGRVYGRFDDIITLKNGKSLTYHQSYQLFRDFHECEQYKFIQEPGGELRLQLKIKQGSDKPAIKSKVLNLWNKHYKGIDLHIEWIDQFEIDEKTGKFKVIEKIKNCTNDK
ncbi:MAG: hypothetical protein PF489_13050 [Salinivirgaceae bacterium]|jgi:phenylacetate-CoA ligase|nr:hypothetical protein [Salinivirgaceae bacterium]